jgi:hypothetical protein
MYNAMFLLVGFACGLSTTEFVGGYSAAKSARGTLVGAGTRNSHRLHGIGSDEPWKRSIRAQPRRKNEKKRTPAGQKNKGGL